MTVTSVGSWNFGTPQGRPGIPEQRPLNQLCSLKDAIARSGAILPRLGREFIRLALPIW
jgi:hypothetical protein